MNYFKHLLIFLMVALTLSAFTKCGESEKPAYTYSYAAGDKFYGNPDYTRSGYGHKIIYTHKETGAMYDKLGNRVNKYGKKLSAIPKETKLDTMAREGLRANAGKNKPVQGVISSRQERELNSKIKTETRKHIQREKRAAARQNHKTETQKFFQSVDLSKR